MSNSQKFPLLVLPVEIIITNAEYNIYIYAHKYVMLCVKFKISYRFGIRKNALTVECSWVRVCLLWFVLFFQ